MLTSSVLRDLIPLEILMDTVEKTSRLAHMPDVFRSKLKF